MHMHAHTASKNQNKGTKQRYAPLDVKALDGVDAPLAAARAAEDDDVLF